MTPNDQTEAVLLGDCTSYGAAMCALTPRALVGLRALLQAHDREGLRARPEQARRSRMGTDGIPTGSTLVKAVALLGLVGLIALTGCGTSQMIVFQKPGVPASQQKADEVACIEASIGEVQDPRPSPLPPIDREAFERCMRAKGYVPVAK